MWPIFLNCGHFFQFGLLTHDFSFKPLRFIWIGIYLKFVCHWCYILSRHLYFLPSDKWAQAHMDLFSWFWMLHQYKGKSFIAAFIVLFLFWRHPTLSLNEWNICMCCMNAAVTKLMPSYLNVWLHMEKWYLHYKRHCNKTYWKIWNDLLRTKGLCASLWFRTKDGLMHFDADRLGFSCTTCYNFQALNKDPCNLVESYHHWHNPQ